MNESDGKRFEILIRSLAAAFDKDASPALIMGYEMGLRDLSIDDIDAACMQAISSLKWMPRPADLRELTGEISSKDRAALAFPELMKAISSVGSYRSPGFTDPVMNAVIRAMGGWQALCAMDEEELNKWGRKDFVTLYGAYMASGVGSEQGSRLIGRHEQENGFPAEGDLVAVKTSLPAHKNSVMIQETPKTKTLTGDAVKLIGNGGSMRGRG